MCSCIRAGILFRDGLHVPCRLRDDILAAFARRARTERLVAQAFRPGLPGVGVVARDRLPPHAGIPVSLTPFSMIQNSSPEDTRGCG
jgi:hypothetical protein